MSPSNVYTSAVYFFASFLMVIVLFLPGVSRGGDLDNLCSELPSEYSADDFIFYANIRVMPVKKRLVVDGVKYREVYLVPFRDYFSNVVAETYFNNSRQYRRTKKKIAKTYGPPTIAFAQDIGLWIFGTFEDPMATLFLDSAVVSIAYACDVNYQ